MTKSLTKFIKFFAFIFSSMIFLVSVFDFQYSLLTGPFLDVLILIPLLILGFILSTTLIPFNGVKKLISYIPLSLIVLSFCLSFLTPQINIGHWLHYLINRTDLERIDNLSREAGVFKMTDMLRYQKRLNAKAISNEKSYTTITDLEKAFGKYIAEQNLNIAHVTELRDRLENSNTISLERTKDYLILTVDGFVDNEYGYIKSLSKELKEGEVMPPYGFVIVRLIDFGDGWYFFYTT